MPLFPGPRYDGIENIVQEALLRVAFVMQDVGAWLVEHGRGFEDWACPSGRRAAQAQEETPYWKQP